MGAQNASLIGFAADWTYEDLSWQVQTGVQLPGTPGVSTLRWHRLVSVSVHPHEDDIPTQNPTSGVYRFWDPEDPERLLYEWLHPDVNTPISYLLTGERFSLVFVNTVDPARPLAAPGNTMNIWTDGGKEPVGETVYETSE